MGLVIPKSQHRAFAKILSYSSDQLSAFEASLAAAKPVLLVDQLAHQVSEKTKLDLRDTREILGMLSSMYITRARNNIDVETFLKDVCDALVETKQPELQAPSQQWDQFKHFFAKVLSLESSLGVTSKALDVLLGNERNFAEARILTDVRPVFPEDASQTPVAAVIVHTLKLSYRDDEGRNSKQFYIAMDSNDLASLKRTIDRAATKEQSMGPLLQKLNLPALRPD